MSEENKKLSIRDELTEFRLYTTPNGNVKVEIFFYDENVWLTQKRMAELFGVGVNTINYHLKEVFNSGELEKNSVIRKYRTTANDGKKYNTNYYNLDAILSVGYRVNSSQATLFRIWASKILKEYIIKGFAMDDERLKNGHYFGKDYFKELLERVRSIRTSERRIYQQITDIFAECSIDYDAKSDLSKHFYAMVQNKFHFAITGQTAAEIVYSKADKKKLERTVSGYFDYIERLIENRTTLTMEKLAESVNKFLTFNEYKILEGKGKISHIQAEKRAFAEYDDFNKTQKIESDFDREIKKLLNNKAENK